MNDYRETTQAVTAVHRIDETTHMHSVRAGVAVPLLQAFVTGALVALIAALVCAYSGVTDWYYWAALSAALTIFGQWMASQALWRRIVRLVEREWQVDIDRDGGIGEPEAPAVQFMRVEVNEKNGGYPQTAYVELPYAERIPQLAAGLAAGEPFTVRGWVGQSRGRLFTPAEFRELRDIFLQRSWIVPNNRGDETRGYSLTRTGAEVMHGLADSPTPELGLGWVKRS